MLSGLILYSYTTGVTNLTTTLPGLVIGVQGDQSE